MWRFFLAGLVTVCGVVLLFMASMGDPFLELHHARTLLQIAAPPVNNPAAPLGKEDAATQQAKDDALHQQVQSLQSQLEQTAQDMTALRGEANAAKRAEEALRQQRDADQAELTRLRSANSATTAATQQPVAPASDAPPPPPKPADTLPPASVSQSRPTALPVKSAQNQPRQIVPDFRGAQAVLNRLRRDPEPAIAEQSASPAPPARSPQARLSDARSALTGGRIEDARRLLEEAQVQLAFRPVAPDGAIASTGGVAAGDVAEALSMLNAGDVRDALRYIDLAMQQSSGPVQPITDAVQSPYREGWSRP